MRTIRIIDSKKINLTDDEFALYKAICADYSRKNFAGADLFKDLFETDKNGIIVFLRPPRKKFTLEVVLFLLNVMVHQHLGTACDEIDKQIRESKDVMSEMNKIISESKILISELKKLSSNKDE